MIFFLVCSVKSHGMNCSSIRFILNLRDFALDLLDLKLKKIISVLFLLPQSSPTYFVQWRA